MSSASPENEEVSFKRLVTYFIFGTLDFITITISHHSFSFITHSFSNSVTANHVKTTAHVIETGIGYVELALLFINFLVATLGFFKESGISAWKRTKFLSAHALAAVAFFGMAYGGYVLFGKGIGEASNYSAASPESSSAGLHIWFYFCVVVTCVFLCHGLYYYIRERIEYLFIAKIELWSFIMNLFGANTRGKR